MRARQPHKRQKNITSLGSAIEETLKESSYETSECIFSVYSEESGLLGEPSFQHPPTAPLSQHFKPFFTNSPERNDNWI